MKPFSESTKNLWVRALRREYARLCENPPPVFKSQEQVSDEFIKAMRLGSLRLQAYKDSHDLSDEVVG